MPNVIGIDIGGTKITGVAFNGRKVVRELTIVTPKSVKDFKFSIGRLVKFLSAGKKISGLGIGQPGVINPKTGKSFGVSNIKILQSLKSQEFYKSLGIKRVKVDNDAHCFALAEAKFGKGKNFNNFIGITLGTGIGGGIILSRRLFLGSHMTAGHIGYVMAGLKDSAEDVYQKFKDKNNVKGIGLVAGIIIANAINLLDLEGVVLGGSVAEHFGQKFLPEVSKTVKKYILSQVIFPKIIISNLKHAPAIGAALLVSKD